MCASDLEGMAPPEMLEEMALKAEPAMSVGENGHDLREMTKEEKARRKQKFRFPRMTTGKWMFALAALTWATGVAGG
ncbi:hypothetical protein SCLCIDRAFT_34389 [Scleroderma citrinum Foug A]|uniref:Uncharacterized protein n=1 Tax=Scleroderma citrinum Foug A TaxID=1036808 RepID=A0A0C2YKP8_9AGAM|nr:hypothetical protein SCLCIDRAFT_34389 [Scleroderma citrinum Foug A]